MKSCIRAVITGLACYSFQTAEQSCFGQIPVSNARLVALGQTSAALDRVYDSRSNPASAAAIADLSAAFGFNRRFGLAELAAKSTTVAVPTGSVVIGGSLAGLGYEEYGTTELSVGLAVVFNSVRTGIRTRLTRHRFDGYGSRSNATFDVGWQYAVKGVLIGASLTGLGSSGTRSDPLTLETGLSIVSRESVLLAISIVQTRGIGPDYRFGAEVSIGVLRVRVGGTGLARSASVGFGLNIDRLEVDVAIANHPRLGPSPVMTLTVSK